METQAINTVVGQLKGRNAIYLDEVKQDYKLPSPLTFKGALSASCCSSYMGTNRFPAYELIFERTSFYSCVELDRYRNERFLSSSFDIIKDSSLLREMRFSSDYQHYILATYDYVYEIIAKDFSMRVES